MMDLCMNETGDFGVPEKQIFMDLEKEEVSRIVFKNDYNSYATLPKILKVNLPEEAVEGHKVKFDLPYIDAFTYSISVVDAKRGFVVLQIA